jgi:hypothetical protein|tara:strand:+ start:162 stop:524 length:363 start_codon:yes stop_codon:yes gene_type:complete
MSKNTEPSFRAAFAKNKKAGKNQFQWNNKNYTTQTASERALNLTSSQLESARNTSYEKAKGSKSKSKNEISESYTREYQFRIGDRIKAQGLDVNKYKDRMKSKNIKGSAFGLDRNNNKKK